MKNHVTYILLHPDGTTSLLGSTSTAASVNDRHAPARVIGISFAVPEGRERPTGRAYYTSRAALTPVAQPF